MERKKKSLKQLKNVKLNEIKKIQPQTIVQNVENGNKPIIEVLDVKIPLFERIRFLFNPKFLLTYFKISYDYLNEEKQISNRQTFWIIRPYLVDKDSNKEAIKYAEKITLRNKKSKKQMWKTIKEFNEMLI